MQFIGKKMRDLSEEEIARARAQVEQDVTLVKRRYMALEKLRTDLLAGGKQALEQLEREQPQADMELVRQLIEKAEGERLQQSTPHASRKLFQLLRKLYGI
jgi:ribosome-associated protein